MNFVYSNNLMKANEMLCAVLFRVLLFLLQYNGQFKISIRHRTRTASKFLMPRNPSSFG